MKGKVVLLDSNVLIALSTPDHTEHIKCITWFKSRKMTFATCPITQGALIRFYMQFSKDKSFPGAIEILQNITQMKNHVFWKDSIPYTSISNVNITGHRQVTDTYLATLTKSKGGILSTLDAGLAGNCKKLGCVELI